MADESDEIIVNLDGDGQLAEGGVDFNEKKPGEGDGSNNEDPIVSLKSQFEQMSGRAAAAETAHAQTRQELDAANQRLRQADDQVVSSQLDTVLSGIAAANAAADSAQQEFIAAAEAGDFAAQARAQRKISAAEAQRVRLEEAKDDLEDVKQRRPVQQQQRHEQPPQRRPAVDPVEEVIQNGGLSSKSAAWLRAHPQAVTDRKLNSKMMAAHHAAVAEDIALDTPEYFKRIEAAIAPVAARPANNAGDGTRPSSAAASGAGNSGGGLNGGISVTLTKGEVASATDGTLVWNYDDPSGKNRFKRGDPIGVAEMARRKHEGKKAGLYDRHEA